MRIQTTFLATLLTAIAVLAADCAAQSQSTRQIQATNPQQITVDASSRFRFVPKNRNATPTQNLNQAIQIDAPKSNPPLYALPTISSNRTNDLVPATFESPTSNDFGLSRTFNNSRSITQFPPTNTYEFQTVVESPSSTRTNIFGIDEDQCCDEWANFTACGGLKTNPGHYGIPRLTGKDNCEAPRGCGCGLRKTNLGCGTSTCVSGGIECTKITGIKSWFKKSDCQCGSCQPIQMNGVEFEQQR
ncbi:MAG: hypothetical protein ACKVHR_17745 [Pirellulales bacterium]